MAGFCRHCGSQLNGTEAFCTSCGGATNFAPSATAAPPPAPVAQPPVPAPPPAAKGSPVVKIIVAVLAVLALCAVMAAAGIWYVAHRIRQRAQALGLNHLPAASARSRTVGGVANGCRLLSQDEVSKAVGMTIARAETSPDNEGCVYYVNATVAGLMAKKMSGEHSNELDAQSRQQVESTVRTMVQGLDTSGAEQNGQVPIFSFGVMDQGGTLEMKLLKGTLGNLGPANASSSVTGLGDEAFSAADVMLYVRKGDRLLMMTFNYLPDGTAKVTPLAQKILAKM
jgi:hypothetical protein